MRLAIISHTRHFRDGDGRIVGWGPTVREINHLRDVFDEVVHVAPLLDGPAPPSSLPYRADGVRLAAIPHGGGVALKDKVSVVRHVPRTVAVIREALREVDVFQFRAPTGIGNYVLPWLALRRRRPGWVKYAGNWAESRPPLSYRFQRLVLARNLLRCPVTINGRWPSQPDHCMTFENPCLDGSEREYGRRLIGEKAYDGVLDLCFAGRLEDAKGVGRILEAVALLPDASRIGCIHFVGDGPKRAEYERAARDLPCQTRFHGYLSRDDLAGVFAACHLFVLPTTASEGFPKVIAEAANYGCVPVVSNVSSIGQYVTADNGIVLDWRDCGGERLAAALGRAVSHPDLRSLAAAAHEVAHSFTFDHYNRRISAEVIPRATG